jgi:hypothetical protein
MKTLWVVILGLLATAAVPGCKRTVPEPIPGPKAGTAAPGHAHTPGIAWFQEGIDEAFARPGLRKGARGDQTCPAMRRPAPPRVTG